MNFIRAHGGDKPHRAALNPNQRQFMEDELRYKERLAEMQDGNTKDAVNS